MENATEALLIAGGILFAILTLSLVTYMVGNVSEWGKAQDAEKELQKSAEWNSEWEAYNKKILYGAEVLTVVNKAEQHNLEYDGNADYKITIIVESDTGKNIAKSELILYKKSIFECVEAKYNQKTGRINYMKYELIEDLN